MAFDAGETLASQYSCSPRIRALLEGFAALVSPLADTALLYRCLLNPLSAQGPCLDVWGRITGQERNTSMVTATAIPHLGFKDDPLAQPFAAAPFYRGGAQRVRFELSDEAYRLYILARAMANISGGSMASLNAMLAALLPGAQIELTRTGPMQLKLTVTGSLSAYEQNLLLSGSLPPVPAGVSLEVELHHARHFGFEGGTSTPFNDGPLFQKN